MSDWQKHLRRLRQLVRRAPATGRGHRSNLSLEMLEDRCVPATLFVNVNGGSDANAGTLAAPFASIQKALNTAKSLALTGANNNTIEVAVGTYTSTTINTDAASLGFPSVIGVVDQAVNIQGGFNASFTAVTGQSVIDGGSSVRGVAVVSSGAAGAPATGITISNFTIQNGVGNPSTIAGNLDGFGGGMVIDLGATPTNQANTLTNITFQTDAARGAGNTSATTNGGSGGEGAGGGLASFFANNVTLNNVTFSGDTAVGGNGPQRGGSGLGGALYGGNGTVYNGTNVTFTNNEAIGGTATSGTGVVSGNQFAEGFGGAVALLDQGTSGTFTAVTATSNVAQGGNAGNAAGDIAGDGRGGVFYSENANLSLTNSTLTNNSAQGGTAHDGGDASAGGAVYATAFTNAVTVTLSQDSFINNVANGPMVTGTSAPVLGGALAADNANSAALTLNVTNSVIAGNSVQSPQTASLNSGGGALWSDGVTVNLLQNTIADNSIASTNMTGSSLLIYHGTDNLAFNIIANETGALPAVASIQGGAVNLTGANLFANVATTGLPAQANLLTAADAKFTNAAGRDYTLQAGSPAIGAAKGSTVTVDRNGSPRNSPPSLGASEFNPPSPPSPPPPNPAKVSELGAYRASNGSWSLDSDGTPGFNSATDQVFFHFSPPNVTGVAGDWTGSGHANIGDFSNGIWHLDLNNNGVVDPGETFTFGQAGDQPVVGDWNGDGKSDLGVFRAAPDGITGEFILDTNENHTLDASDTVFTFGLATDHIIVGDWNGDGKTKVGVYRDAKNYIAADAGDTVFSINSNGDRATFTNFVFGLITDKVVIGDWNGSGTSKVGTYRDGSAGYNAPGTALFSLDTNGNLQFDPGVDQVFLYGLTTDQFVTGNWQKTPPLQPSEFSANGVGPGAPALTNAQLNPVVQQAIAYWTAKGADAAQLESVPVRIGQLNGNLLGWTDATGITISADAAGWGWSTDVSSNPAAGRMDLLTVVEHEFGHEVGLSDVDPASHPGDLMDSTLPTGVRRQ